MQLIPFGTNGFFASFGRQTACYAIPLNKILIILDAGTGLFRFAEPAGIELLKDAEEIHIYLSHYHLDHTFGFYAATSLFKGKRVSVYASSDMSVFSELTTYGYTVRVPDNTSTAFSWISLQKEQYDMKSYSVSVRKQFHNGAESFAFRFSFGLAYVTDSEPTLQSVSFLKNINLLLHEHYFSGGRIITKSHKLKDQFEGGHTTSAGAALVAHEANAKRLLLIHHYPYYDQNNVNKITCIAKRYFPNTDSAKDLVHVHW